MRLAFLDRFSERFYSARTAITYYGVITQAPDSSCAPPKVVRSPEQLPFFEAINTKPDDKPRNFFRLSYGRAAMVPSETPRQAVLEN